ncbi:MAG: hypothetical protein J6C13_00225 [Clostridia bacterium]|nr:hypothetical protein [Clostridia bacterium]
MNIGLDIDNVITAFDNDILKEFLKEDKNKRNAGIINKKARHINHGMFDWSQDEVNEFYNNNMERIAKGLKPRRNCKKYMDKLLQDGHNLILISHRAYPHYQNPEEITIDWLEKYKINYTKLILSNAPDKTKECKENNIDIMIDDRATQCKKMRANGINCILMFTKYNRKEVEDLPFVTCWKNLYDEITKLCKK